MPVVAPVEISFTPEDNVYEDGVRIAPSTAGDFVVRSGSKLSVLFGASGVRVEDIRWTKDGSALPFDDDRRLSVLGTPQGSQLTVSNINASDSGSYVAEASKDGEVATASVDIRVAGKALLYVMITFSNAHMPYAGSNDPVITRHAGVSSQTTDSDVRASVSQPQVMVRSGQTLTLTSPATGSPRPVISWYKDGTLLSTGGDVRVLSDGSLEVKNFGDGHVGTYQSQATSGELVDSQDTDVVLAGE